MSDRIVAGVPLSGMKLSAKASKAVKAYEEAKARYVTYVNANRDCVWSKSYSAWHGHQEHKPAALVKAEAELRKLDEEALAKGETLPNRDEYLSPVLARIDEYKRTEPLLRKAMETAEAAAIDAVRDELPALARQIMERATEAREAYAEALAKVEEAEIRFKASIDRFVGYVTGGVVQGARYRGIHSNAVDKWLNAWEVSDNGRLSWFSAWSLGLVGPGKLNVDTIDLGPFVEPEPESHSTEEIHKMTGLA